MTQNRTEQEDVATVKKSGYTSGYTISPNNIKSHLRTDARFWKSRVFHHRRVRAGETIEDAHYSVRIAFGKRREQFNTGEREKAAAAAIAAEIYRSLDRVGWDATLELFKPAALMPPPETVAMIECPTVGAYLELVSTEGGLQPKTFAAYARMFRLITSEIAKVKKTKSRFNALGGGLTKWRNMVDALPLDAVTIEAVRNWQRAFLKKAGAEPTEQARAEVTMNSVIRQAKGLFSKRVIAIVKDRVRLPEPLPLVGVEFKKVPSSYYRYRSKMDAGALLTAGLDELGGDRLAEYQILVLALCCGLRRNELDKLLWNQVDFTTGKISIETTRYFKAKSDASNGEVDMELELVALLRGWKLRATSEFVIEGEMMPRLGVGYSHYRLQRQLDSLVQWLRGKGVDAPKPLHTLRKEYGALVLRTHGIYAASCALRHEDLQVTVRHYADTKERATPGLGAMLAPPNVQTVEFAAPSVGAHVIRAHTRKTKPRSA